MDHPIHTRSLHRTHRRLQEERAWPPVFGLLGQQSRASPEDRQDAVASHSVAIQLAQAQEAKQSIGPACHSLQANALGEAGLNRQTQKRGCKGKPCVLVSFCAMSSNAGTLVCIGLGRVCAQLDPSTRTRAHRKGQARPRSVDHELANQTESSLHAISLFCTELHFTRHEINVTAQPVPTRFSSFIFTLTRKDRHNVHVSPS